MTARKKQDPEPKYVAMKMNSGNITMNLFGKETAMGNGWLPDGCCGVIFVFHRLDDLRRYAGEDAEYTMIRETQK